MKVVNEIGEEQTWPWLDEGGYINKDMGMSLQAILANWDVFEHDVDPEISEDICEDSRKDFLLEYARRYKAKYNQDYRLI